MASDSDTSQRDEDNEEGNELCFAKVKFICDNSKDVIPIKDIKGFDVDNWPENIYDFDKKNIYTCTYKNKLNPVEAEYGIQIGLFSVSKTTTDRPRFAKLNKSIIDTYNEDNSTSTDHEKYEDEKVQEQKAKAEQKKLLLIKKK
uniref:Uncharacterized protein n=1 Tax=Trichogramma kaykai TaxID=54128 RepID=A0ABD2WHB7_9HYME